MNFTTKELLAVYLSRQLEDKSFGYAGTGSLVGMAACLLAQDIHAPDLSWMAGETGFVNPSPPLVKSLSGYCTRTEATKSINAVTRYLSRGFDFFIAESGQIDRFARINRQFSADGTCSAGTGSTSYLRLAKKVLLFSKIHNKQILTNKVSFISAWRKIKSSDFSTYFVTPQVVFTWKFDDKNENNLSEPLLIGVFAHSKSIKDIKSITGFKFKVSDDLETVESPTDEELDSMKDIIDPRGYLND